MIKTTDMNPEIPKRIIELELPEREGSISAREADLKLLELAPEGFLDTTHFDTVRFPPPDWASEMFHKASVDGSLAYTPYRGHKNVLNKLSDSISKFMGTEIGVENLILAPGTQAGLFITLSSIVEQGERVALMSPDYLFNARILKFLGADIGYVPLKNSSTNPAPDFAALENEFKNGAKVFIFSNPNNPTGYVYSTDDIKTIAHLADKYDVTVLADSLYSRLMHNNQSYTHLAAMPGMKKRVITLLGPSKTESLSGYRLGIVVAPEHLMPRLENVLSLMALRAPAYAQHLLTYWLSEDKEWLSKRLPEFTQLRDMTVKSFRRLPWLKINAQEGTAYAWIDVSALGMKDSEIAEQLMEHAGVLVSPGYQFGIQGDGCFRVCYARDEKIWAEAMNRMIDVLSKLADQKNISASKILCGTI